MKNFIKLLFLLIFSTSSFSQSPTSITPVCGNIPFGDAPDYTYFMDVDQKFNPFIGTWKYINGSEIVTFELSKITQKYLSDEKIFIDYMVGNYSYSLDGGNTFVVNTIPNIINSNPNSNPMYTSCSESNSINFYFDDVILNKKLCYATFEFLSGSTTQMHLKIENPKEIGGSLNGTTYNYDFTLPTDIIVTKQ